MIYLRSVSRKGPAPTANFPFSLPAYVSLDEIRFDHPVTFFVGENGSGKSTLMEAIAAGCDAVTVGGVDLRRDPTMEPARQLGGALRFEWGKRTRRGFFLRAEDFFNYTRRLKAEMEELDELRAGYEAAYEERPFADGLRMAIGSARAQKAALVEKYGEDLNANSHGESFLKLFQGRIAPGGLYLLDEPEAPLSPLRQIAFLSLLKQSVEDGSQFLIATHSPILMAFPDAAIFSFDSRPVRVVAYDELEHVTLTRSFLNYPEAFLRRL